MSARLFVPRTLGEAERFLWHAQGHLANNREVCCSEHMTEDTKAAMQLLYECIKHLQEAK